jgi:hypothetical protein
MGFVLSVYIQDIVTGVLQGDPLLCKPEYSRQQRVLAVR